MERLQNFIGGEWQPALSGKTAPDTNPACPDEVLAEYPLSSEGDARAAIAAAKNAKSEWRKISPPKRGDILFRAVRLFEQRKEELARVLTREEGKTVAESRGEVQKAINILEFVAGMGRRWNGESTSSELPSTFCYTVREPLGVVAVITPWNFPVAIPVWKLAPALLCGNTVVFKPASLTPWTAKIITEIFAEAGVVRGALNLVYGSGGAVGDVLVTHPDVAAVTFTGSNEVGSRLYAEAAKSHKKVQCEMGGKNALVVLEDADLELAAQATVQGAFGSTGQRCTATSRAVVHRQVYEAFLSRVVELTRGLRMGRGTEDGVQVGPVVDEVQLKNVLSFVEVAKKDGARLVLGGGRPAAPELAKGYFVEPTIFADVRPEMRIACEEAFGPLLSVMPVGDFDEALAVTNNVAYGLSSSIYSNDMTRVMRFVEQVETGITHVNSPTVGGEAHLPFGGMKATGVGEREMGSTSIEFFSQWKTVYIDYTGTKRTTNIY
jgi:aldehyde dehydrogenase (NAD+)